MNLSISKIAKILDLQPEADNNQAVLLTDSRDLTYPHSTIFAALHTAGNDGHRYIPELYDQGVKRFIVDSVWRNSTDVAILYPDANFLVVPDVLSALQKIASYERKELKMPIVGITGSQGKTTVKEMMYQMLREHVRAYHSPRSYNSQLGVPLSVLLATPDYDVALFEAGISQPGEMVSLQEILYPEIGVFTSLTDEHSSQFSSLEEKALEKAELFKDSKAVFYPAQDKTIEMALKRKAPNSELHGVDMVGCNTSHEKMLALAKAVCEYALSETIESEKAQTVTPRIDVRDTLKDCLLICDAFTVDLRSIEDALDFARKRLSASSSLTAIIQYPPFDSSFAYDKLLQLLRAKGVKRFIGIGFPQELHKSLMDSRCDASMQLFDTPDEFMRQLSISDFNHEVILVKGEPNSGFEDIAAHLETPRHQTVMEIDLGAIVQNFNYYRSLLPPGSGLVAMVKAAGYGVGSLELAKTLQAQGAAYLAVAVIDEGAELRRAGITMPIIVMNPISTNFKALFDNRLEPAIFSMRELNMLLDHARRYSIEDYPVHIKLDTGMHRLGFLDNEIPSLLEALNNQTQVKAVSIFSHLATADCLDQDEYTYMQLDTFEKMSQRIIEGLPYIPKRHILNTAGIMRFPEYHYDMARLGIGLYGVTPYVTEKRNLAIVARLFTTIISIKEWPSDTSIGYGRRGRTDKNSIIATIPIGYADGLNRGLSCGKASFIVNGHECPVVGNICMDQCMIDVTNAGARIGDKVEIFGEMAPIERLSDTLGTIPYEILTSISPRVKRIYFRQ